MIKTLEANRGEQRVFEGILRVRIHTRTRTRRAERKSIEQLARDKGYRRHGFGEGGKVAEVAEDRACMAWRLLAADRLMRLIVRERASLLNRGRVARACIVLRGGKLRPPSEERESEVFLFPLIGDEKWRVSIRNKNMNRRPPRSSIFIRRPPGRCRVVP